MVRLLVLVTLTAIFLFVPVPGSIGTKCVCGALFHHFWHISWFHLAANGIGIYASSLMRGWKRRLPLAYIFACVGYLFSSGPVIGFSNVLFALAGMYGAEIRDYWKRRETWAFLAGLALTSVLPNVSASTHVASFLIGYVCIFFYRTIKKVVYDYERAGGK